jgi:hypothetical protein
VEPLAIKAAIRRIQENKTGEQLMAELAAPVLDERSFGVLVNDYYSSLRRAATAAPDSSFRRPPMRGMACEPEREPVAA